MKIWRILVISLVGLANATGAPLDFTAQIDSSEAQFHGKETVVLLYDIENRKTVSATPAAGVVKFHITSLIKPIIIDEAILRQAVSWDSIIDCNGGQLPVDGRILRDAVPLGKLPVTKVLSTRSNIGTFKILEKIGDSAIGERLKAADVTVGGNSYDDATGWGIVVSADQVVRLYALLQKGTREKLPRPYLSTGLLDADRNHRRYFPCALGFVEYDGRPHLLLVGIVHPHPVYYAGKTAGPLWLGIAAILTESKTLSSDWTACPIRFGGTASFVYGANCNPTFLP